MIRQIVCVAMLLGATATGWAQLPAGISPSQVKVENLSDEQILAYWKKAKENGISDEQGFAMLRQRGVSEQQIEQLKERLEQLQGEGDTATSGTTDRTKGRQLAGKPSAKKDQDKAAKETKDEELLRMLKPTVFGADLFQREDLSFEPNLNIPTPVNYVVGPNDALNIDVYGFNETSGEFRVSPDGFIRVPGIGPIQVSGLTIEQASGRIRGKLASIYSGLGNGQTAVRITLGNIRSIKVLVVGESFRPGTYTLPSLATVYHALHASGGPGQKGSFRHIEVIRQGKVVSRVDLYDFLVKGQALGDIRLQDQDVIKVHTYRERVQLVGLVKRPALYEIKQGETLQQLIGYAGGFADNAYQDLVKLVRNTPKERSVQDIPVGTFASFRPQAGDVYTVGQILDRFNNRVSVEGAVFRPGDFSLEEGMTLRQLLEKADGLTEDAFISRATLVRKREDLSPEVVAVNLGELMSGKAADVSLRKEDRLVILSKFDLREERKVRIEGAVRNPGEYEFADNMAIEDLIILAGGVLETANLKDVEISRPKREVDVQQKGYQLADIIRVDVSQDLGSNSPILQPHDRIFIRKKPGEVLETKVVKVSGEVFYPGEYSISTKNFRISELIGRVGGVLPNAYVQGASLTRQLDVQNRETKRKQLEVMLKDSTETYREEFIKDALEKAVFVNIDLEKAMKHPGSEYDLMLKDGDQISVPAILQTVKVNGEVVYPKLVRHSTGRLKYYVRQSGGYADKANKKGTYVLYPNGEVRTSRNFVLFRSNPKVRPGSEIFVPTQPERKKLSAGEAVGLGSALASMGLIIVTIINAFK